MVDSPNGPAGRPEKPQADPLAGARQEPPPVRPILAEVVTQNPSPRPRLQPAPLVPPEFLGMIEWCCRCLPIFLVVCGVLASAVLFVAGHSLTGLEAGSFSGGVANESVFFNGLCSFLEKSANRAGTGLIGLSFFVGPLLFGIAGILYRLNQRKRD